MLRLGSTAFFTFGIALTLLGATQAEMARDLSLDLAASGFLGAVLALGLGVGVLIAGPLVDRFSRAPLFAGACLLAAAGLFAIDPSRGYAGSVACLLVTGVGCGSYNTLTNAVVIERAGARGASALAIVHSSATLGASIGPVIVRFGLGWGEWSDVFHALGWAHLALSVGAIGLRGSQRSAATSVVTSAPAHTRLPLGAAAALAALGLVTFAYVGVESGLTLFAVPWAVSRGEPERVGQWGISTFWFGLLIGRLSLVIRRGDGDKRLQLLAASGFAGATIVCLSSALALGPLVLVMTLAGIVLGPVYPVAISLAANRVPTAAATALGLVAATGACGGFAIPWLTGAVGDSNGVPLAMALLGAYALLIAVAAIALFQRDARLQRARELVQH